MAVIQRVVKPVTRKGKKILLSRQPQVVEDPKRTLFFKGRKSSMYILNILHDLYNLKKPDAHMLSKRNDITIFEDATPVEIFCRKHDCALFVMGSRSKKRPNNLVIGRMFDNSLLDMIELSVDSYQGLKEFTKSKIGLGIKPSLVFSGPAWEQTNEMQRLKSIFVDLFHREKVNAVCLQGLEHLICFTATPEMKILIRSYKVLLKKSGSKIPRIELEEIGPRLNLSIGRSKLATDDLYKQACRKPKVLKIIKKKNISRDGLGTTHGRIHVGKQQINKIQTRKMKGLRKTVAQRKEEKLQKRKSSDANLKTPKKPKVQE